MSGYRAAPIGARVEFAAEGRTEPDVWVKQSNGKWWALCIGNLFYDALDCLYWSRRDALEEAAKACEEVGRLSDVAALGTATHCAAAVRKMMEGM